MKYLRTVKKILGSIAAVFIMLIAFPAISKACHLAAADIFIEYAGIGVDPCLPTPDYTYNITMVTYSSCNCGLTTGANETLRYESVNGGTGVLQTTLVSTGIDIIDQLCPTFSAINQCRVPANNQYPGYRRRTYTATVTLPSAQTDWKFWWSSSARNPSTNLVGTGSLYIEAGMDVTARFNNSTPRFQSNPLPYICVGQEYEYLNLPFDPDEEDSVIITSTTTPLTGAASTVTYAGGYSMNSPINSYKLDSYTGTATFVPIITGLYTLSFKAEDVYSYVLRDVQIAVLPCLAAPPKMTKIPQNLQNASLIGIENKQLRKTDSVIFVCPGSEVSFDINASTDTPTNMLWMRSDYTKFNGSTFNTAGDGTDKVTGTFKWTPTTNDYGIHYLVVTTVDSTCNALQPIVLESNVVIQIRVVRGLDAGPDLPICELNPSNIQLFVKNTEHLSLQWSVAGGGPLIGFNVMAGDDTIHNPLLKYPHINGTDTIKEASTLSYIIATTDLVASCKAIDTVVVYIDTSNTVEIFPKNPNGEEKALVLCRPDYLQLEALISGRRPLYNLDCGTSAPILCKRADYITKDVFGAASLDTVSYDTIGGSTTPVMYVDVRTSKKEYLIRKEDLKQWGVNSGTLRSIGIEVIDNSVPTHEFANFSISMMCTNKQELSLKEGFNNTGMRRVYFAPTTTMEPGWHDYDLITPFNMDTSKNLIIQICYSNNPNVVTCDPALIQPRLRFVPTNYISGLSIKAPDDNMKTICPTGISQNTLSLTARPLFRFAYCESDTSFEIIWKEGSYLSDSSIQQPLAYVPESDRFIVQTIGRSGCIMRDTLEVYVPDNEYSITPEDTAICFGEETPVSVEGGFYFKWYEYINGNFVKRDDPGAPEDFSISCFDCRTPIIHPNRTTDYRIVVSDSVFCYDTLSSRIVVKPLPDVRILNTDSTIKYGQDFRLMASGARIYNWSPVSSLNNPNISYPIARPTEDTRYVVSGLGMNGCYAYDTVYIEVDDRAPLFVPSAFSPNGDGRNDMFKIVNLTFQRVMEFRVFNRYGQEIFSTTGESNGWDGTWNGKPQDIGTYTYLIRVGYPDGFTETYKGEVTLVR